MTGPRPAAAVAGLSVLNALRRALPLVLSPRLVGALLRWLLGALVLWLVIGLFAFEPASAALAQLFGADADELPAVKSLVVVVLVIAAILSVVVAIAVFTMPLIVRLVSQRYFPALEQRHGGTWHGGLRNAVLATLLFVPAWLACFALVALPPLYLAATWCLGAWFNQRLFRYDALAEHADREELARLPVRIRGRLFALGLVLAPLTVVPFVNLLVPLLSGIAFACLCLDALARDRGARARTTQRGA